MKRFISVICVCCTLFLSFSSAFVKREIDIVCEEIIPFNFTSDESKLEDYISLKEYENVEIIDYYTDNGEIEVEKEDEWASVILYDGEYIDGTKTVTKIKSLSLEEAVSKEGKKIIVRNIDEKIKDIQEVSGDFKSAKVIDENTIEITVDESAKGNVEESNTETMISELNIELPKDNTKSEVYSDYYDTLYEPLNIESITLSNGEAEVEIEGNKLRVFFCEGTPKLNESFKTDGYTYFWADRCVDGTFKKEYPNSVYRSDRKYFIGEGEYIEGEKATRELAYEVARDEKWVDYSGVIIDGVKYMYLYDNTKDIPDFNDRIILDSNKISLDGQWCNTEKLDIEFEEDLIRYTPNGKLYSVGELVDNTLGWGEIAPNQFYESDEEFFNELTGKYETYVKHFKFFYGPKEKVTFGGYFTYPYSATIKYEHYKPVTVYSGNVIYTYDEDETYKGYNYNGWIKIRYSDTKSINDYPPTSPYNIRYNEKIIWNPGNDDYTPQNKLKYEIEVNIDGIWQAVNITGEGQIEYIYDNGESLSFRVRTIDEVGQVSDWAYTGESEIKLSGSVSPKVIKSGESIDINAVIHSLSNVVKVEAECEELEIDEELIKFSETIPNYNEISLALWATSNKEPYINTKSDTWSYNDGEKNIIRSFKSEALTDEHLLTIKLPKTIEIGESGTFILPNQNYLGTPIDVVKINKKWYYLESGVKLNINSKITNKKEQFIYFINDFTNNIINKRGYIKVYPKIMLHTFKYDERKPEYIQIPIDPNIAAEPISVTWTTNEKVTSFNIFFGDTLVYVHDVSSEDIENVAEGFVNYEIRKRLFLLRNTTNGFTFDSEGKYYLWPNFNKLVSMFEIPWLGYKIKSERIDEEKLEEYNNLSTTRNVNRLLFMDKAVELSTIKKYLDLIKTTNLPLQKGNENTIFANSVRERNCEFYVSNVSTNKFAKAGTYNIKITAHDDEGNIASIELPIEVVEDERNVEVTNDEEISIGRFFYDNSKNRYVEELSKLQKDNSSEGFISAGETLAFIMNSSDAEYLEIDIKGNDSVKTYDDLTKRFLEEEPNLRGEETSSFEENYNLPLTIYPVSTDDDGYNNFVWLYKIPYRTKQSLESWASLREKSRDSENIDKSKLFDRILEPYELIVRKNGREDKEIRIKFDVFERWDTVLNRNVSSYLSNYLEKWRKEI